MNDDSHAAQGPQDPEDAPGLVEILRAPNAKALRLASLVLQATGVIHTFEQVGEGSHGLFVHARDAERAWEQLDLYATENKDWGAPQEELVVMGGGWAVAIGYTLLLVWCFILQKSNAGGLGWTENGISHAGSVMSGEWWRNVTALTLHADVAHLAGNLVFGALFLVFCSQVLGVGMACWAVLLAAVMGNQLEVLARAPDSRSLGASTAVFAAFGVLGGAHWQRLRRRGEKLARSLAPFAIALAFFSMWGVGDGTSNVNVLAHGTGLACGIFFGALIGRHQRLHEIDDATQLLLSIMALAAIGLAWGLALT